MAHLTCLKHGKRVFVNPETKSVLHRSEDVNCDLPLKWGELSFDYDVYMKLRFCTHCNLSESDIKEYNTVLCNERVNCQPHVFL